MAGIAASARCFREATDSPPANEVLGGAFATFSAGCHAELPIGPGPEKPTGGGPAAYRLTASSPPAPSGPGRRPCAIATRFYRRIFEKMRRLENNFVLLPISAVNRPVVSPRPCIVWAQTRAWQASRAGSIASVAPPSTGHPAVLPAPSPGRRRR